MEKESSDDQSPGRAARTRMCLRARVNRWRQSEEATRDAVLTIAFVQAFYFIITILRAIQDAMCFW